jgi:hypothetical protein
LASSTPPNHPTCTFRIQSSPELTWGKGVAERPCRANSKHQAQVTGWIKLLYPCREKKPQFGERERERERGRERERKRGQTANKNSPFCRGL